MSKAAYAQFFTNISNSELAKEYLTFHINKVEIISEKEKRNHIASIPMMDDNIEPKQKVKATFLHVSFSLKNHRSNYSQTFFGCKFSFICHTNCFLVRLLRWNRFLFHSTTHM